MDLTTTYRRYVAALANFHRAAGEAAGLGSTDYQAASLLDTEGPLSTGQLGHLLHLSPSAATRVVDRLIAAGMAERAPHPQDRRRTTVHHTGWLPEELSELLGRTREPIQTAVAALSDEQQAGLLEYFRAATETYHRAAEPQETRKQAASAPEGEA